jgi:hypothetical protein
MGKVQCKTLKQNKEDIEFIEYSIANRNTPLDKKVKDEYIYLKTKIENDIVTFFKQA